MKLAIKIFNTKYLQKINDLEKINNKKDKLAIEAPLKIILTDIDSKNRPQTLTTLLRTPTNDQHLVAGFLFAEGYFKSPDEIDYLHYHKKNDALTVISKKKIEFKKRLALTHSGCSSCALDDLKQLYQHLKKVKTLDFTQSNIIDLVNKINTKTKQIQPLFESTGGVHASALFDEKLNLLSFAEDVGRHNALDKAIGQLWLQNNLQKAYIAWISGRMGFELVQKAINANISLLISVGAPTSLAIELAKDYGLKTIGFAKKNQFNCYS